MQRLKGTVNHNGQNETRIEENYPLYAKIEEAAVPKGQSREPTLTIRMPTKNDCAIAYPSIIGKILEVSYELQIFIKHDAWNAWGKGKVVS